MPVIPDARYAHTNLCAEDWRRLVAFYVDVLGCEPLGPERDLGDEALARGSGIEGARLEGRHLRLPGCGAQGPTLEIFSYRDMPARRRNQIHEPGFGHLCFRVADVEAARAAVLAHGGRALGEVVRHSIEGAGVVTWCYVTDPEGNGLELQRWDRVGRRCSRAEVT